MKFNLIKIDTFIYENAFQNVTCKWWSFHLGLNVLKHIYGSRMSVLVCLVNTRGHHSKTDWSLQGFSEEILLTVGYERK